MPSSIVKLAASDARAWSANAPCWLTPEGEVHSPVSREEQQAISKVLERSARVQSSFRQTVPLLPMKRERAGRRIPAKPGTVPLVNFAFEVTFVGHKRVVTVFKDQLRYATGRDVLSARLLADHGECVLHGRNGKCIGVLRDPYVQSRPKLNGSRVQKSRGTDEVVRHEQEVIDHARGTRPTKKRPPVVRRTVMPAPPPGTLVQTSTAMTQPSRVLTTPSPRLGVGRGPMQPVAAPTGVSVSVALSPTPESSAISPEKCPHDCRGKVAGGPGWTLSPTVPAPADDQHHPFCPHASAWKAASQPSTGDELVLYDIELATVMREAEPSEIEEARESEARTQMPNVTVQDRVYAVLPRKFAEQAAAEARGEMDASETTLDEHESDTIVPEADAPESTSTEDSRRDWPTLDTLQRSAIDLRENAEITARDYLTRRPGSSSPAP
jgi:hypothetical protein